MKIYNIQIVFLNALLPAEIVDSPFPKELSGYGAQHTLHRPIELMDVLAKRLKEDPMNDGLVQLMRDLANVPDGILVAL